MCRRLVAFKRNFRQKEPKSYPAQSFGSHTYSHIVKTGDFIAISAIAGVNPKTGELAGSDIGAQTRQIMESFDLLLASANSDFAHVLHINVFLTNMSGFDQMNLVYADFLGNIRPARTVISVCDVPRRGALLTMNLTAVTAA